MNKKITKTIVLIVFAVFFGIKFGINDVDAYAKKCVYGYSVKNVFIPGVKVGPFGWNEVSWDDYTQLVFYINHDASEIKLENNSDAPNGDIHNWDKADVGDFVGQDYYRENHGACPPYLIVAQYSGASDEIYFSDDNNFSISDFPKKGLSSKEPYHIFIQQIHPQDESFGEDYVDLKKPEDRTEEDEQIIADIENEINRKIVCKCSNESDNVEYKFTLGGPTSPSENLYVNGVLNRNKTIKNWNKTLKGTNYIVSTKSCPYEMIVSETSIIGSYNVYMSDYGSIAEIIANTAKKDGAFNNPKIYEALCVDYTAKQEEEEKLAKQRQEEDLKSYQKQIEAAKINGGIGSLNSNLDTYNCGNNYMSGIPVRLPRLVKFIYNFIHILVPLSIMILGSIDLIKAVAGQKEDDIKKNQQIFLKRLLSAALVFFVFAIVKLVVGIVGTNSDGVIGCMDCFIKNDGSCVLE